MCAKQILKTVKKTCVSFLLRQRHPYPQKIQDVIDSEDDIGAVQVL